MSTPSPTPGFVLWCDHEGKVLEVICDTLGVSQRLNFEQTLPLLLDRASLGKTLNFLLETRIQGAALDWELNMPLDGQTLTLHFVGVRMHDRLLIVAAQNKTNLMQLYEAMMELNNAQINALRTTVKGQSQLALSGPAPAAWSQQDDAAYNTITQFNNELVNLQRELAKKNAELERLNAQKNQFLGMASHDLRAPLGAILAYSELLLEETADVLDKEQREFLSIIRASSDFLLGMVNDLLDISTIESGKLQIDRRPTDLAALVKSNLALNQILASRKQIRLQIDRR